VRIDPYLSIGHYLTALASIYAGNAEAADKHAELASQTRYHDPLARGNVGALDNVRGTISFATGRYRDGIAFASKTISQNPLQVPGYRALLLNAAAAGELDQAKSAFNSLRRLAPNIERFVEESSLAWSRRDIYQQYAEAFRLAGLP